MSAEVINTSNDTPISDSEWFVDKNQFPTSIASLNSTIGDYLSFDIKCIEERAYNFSLRLFTNYSRVPYIDIPFNVVSTNINVEEAIQFDPTDFYVRKNKYFLSLVKLSPKERLINIVNRSNIPLNITEIKFFVNKDRYGVENISITNNSYLELPFMLTEKNKLTLDLEFLGTDFGHFISFIILTTDLGEV